MFLMKTISIIILINHISILDLMGDLFGFILKNYKKAIII